MKRIIDLDHSLEKVRVELSVELSYPENLRIFNSIRRVLEKCVEPIYFVPASSRDDDEEWYD